MRYTEIQVARVAYATYRQLCIEQGMPVQPPWPVQRDEVRDWWVRWSQQSAWGWSSRQIHEDWRTELIASGWRYGPDIDYDQKVHPGLAPWTDLGREFLFRLDVVQMTTVAITLFAHPFWVDEARVTAPLSEIAPQ